MTDTENKKFWTLSRLRTTWEYKSLAFIGRFFVAAFIVLYLVLTAPYIWPWIETAYARTQAADQFDRILVTAIKLDNYNWADRWLNARPRIELAQHSATLENHIDKIPAVMLWSIVKTARQGDDEQRANFWLMYLQYRLRLDVLRCGINGLGEEVSKISAMSVLLHKDAEKLAEIGKDPDKMAALLQQVLDYDAQHPADNSPLYTCNKLKGIIPDSNVAIPPQEVWATIRHTLRLVTEAGIRKMREQKKASQATKPATP